MALHSKNAPKPPITNPNPAIPKPHHATAVANDTSAPAKSENIPVNRSSTPTGSAANAPIDSSIQKPIPHNLMPPAYSEALAMETTILLLLASFNFCLRRTAWRHCIDVFKYINYAKEYIISFYKKHGLTFFRLNRD
ncbi:MAG: hypothetical protein CMO64_02125 [Verrucomicrobiales bacterium]|nr:hypothetical protein [Verrucomicrobiales bacterium]